MVKVQTHHIVSRDYRGPDRRRSGFLGRARRRLISLVRNRWVAMFGIAFAVSWSFHQVDERSQRRVEVQQRVIMCVIQDVALLQEVTPQGERINVRAILEACRKHEGK